MARRKPPENPNQGQFDFPGYSTAPQQGFLDFDTGGIGWETPAAKQRRNRKPYKKQIKPGPGQQELPFGPAQDNLPTVWKDPNAPAPNPNASKSLVPTGNLPVPTGNLPVPTGNLPVPTGNLPVPYPKPGPEDGPGPKPGPNPSPPGQPGQLPSGPRPKPPTNWAQIGNITASLLTNYRSSAPGLSEESRNLLYAPGALQREQRMTGHISLSPNQGAVKFAKQDPLGYRRDPEWGKQGYKAKDSKGNDTQDRMQLLDHLQTKRGMNAQDAEDFLSQQEQTPHFQDFMKQAQAENLKPDEFKTDEEMAAQTFAGTPGQRFMAGFGGTANTATSAGKTRSSAKAAAQGMNPYARGNRTANAQRATGPGWTSQTSAPKPNWSGKYSGGTPNMGNAQPSSPGGFAGQRTQAGQDFTHGGATSGTGSAWWDVHTQTVNQPSFRQPRQPRQPGQTYNN